tara:strand:+ start:368 stop:637 length:270 start_codon:yes stop_codon:yes gene_type:complete
MAEKDKIMRNKPLPGLVKNGITPLKKTGSLEQFKKDFSEKTHKTPPREILQNTDRQKMEDMRRMAGANPIASIGAGIASVFGMDKKKKV